MARDMFRPTDPAAWFRLQSSLLGMGVSYPGAQQFMRGEIVHDAGDRKAIVALIGLLLKQSAACGTTAGQH
jgi:hypothetical protein